MILFANGLLAFWCLTPSEETIETASVFSQLLRTVISTSQVSDHILNITFSEWMKMTETSHSLLLDFIFLSLHFLKIQQYSAGLQFF